MSAARPVGPLAFRSVGAVALGGGLGAVLRWWLGELALHGAGFPWTTFGTNVAGSFVLALLPALAAVRARPRLVLFLGPGVLGGFTTLSAYAEESRALLADGDGALALAYVLGTLLTCLLAVAVASRWSTRQDRAVFAAEEGDE